MNKKFKELKEKYDNDKHLLIIRNNIIVHLSYEKESKTYALVSHNDNFLVQKNFNEFYAYFKSECTVYKIEKVEIKL